MSEEYDAWYDQFFGDGDDDDDYDKWYESLSDYEKWTEDYAGYLLEDRENFESYPEEETYPFYNNIYVPAKAEIEKITPEILYSFYPEMRDVLYPKVLEQTNERINNVGIYLLFGLFKLITHSNRGDDLRKVYDKFDKMEKRFEEHEKSRPFWLDLQLKYPETAQEIWTEVEDHFFNDTMDYMNHWDYLKLHKFSVPMQQVLIKYCPEILDFERDQWIVFHDILYMEFTDFEFSFDMLATAAELKMTEEETLLPYKEFMEVAMAKSKYNKPELFGEPTKEELGLKKDEEVKPQEPDFDPDTEKLIDDEDDD